MSDQQAQATDGYREYLRSPHWKEVQRAYRKSGRLRACIVCDDPKYDLHHVSYDRLGSERLDDLLPLCRRCHDEVHAHAERKSIPIYDTHRILMDLYFLEPLQIAERLHPARERKAPTPAKAPAAPYVDEYWTAKKSRLSARKNKRNRAAKAVAKTEAKKDAERAKRFRKYFAAKAT